MDCGTVLVKYILFIFNAIVLAISILGCFFCIVMLRTIGDHDGNGGAVFPILGISLCSIAVFISLLGCCGACQKSVFIIRSYAAIWLIQIVLQLGLLILMSTHKEKIEEFVGILLDYAWMSSHAEGGTFNTIQKWIYCCGRDSPDDYKEVGHTKPLSCYNGSQTNHNLYEGCRGKLIEYLYLATDKFVVISVISIQLIFFIISWCFANNMGIYKRQKSMMLSTPHPHP
ncbi:hypothetical protein KR084_001402 [Drosophila pseudotakahashii]|nr:hypothetical protein KR084_001402 [Drosophila pseudotakahashii]